MSWELVFDPEGHGCLINPDDPDGAQLLDDKLRRTLVATSGDPLVVKESLSDGSVKEWSLSRKLQEAVEVEVSIRVGALRTQQLAPLYVFSWP